MADLALTELMNQSITVHKFRRLNQYGDQIHDTDNPQTVACRITHKPEMVRANDGREVVASTVIWCDGDEGVAVQDKVELPDGSAPLMVRVDTLADESGANHHQKIYLQKTGR